MSRRTVTVKMTPGEEGLLDALREFYAVADRAQVIRTAVLCLANCCGLAAPLLDRAREERANQRLHYKLRKRIVGKAVPMPTPKSAKGSR